MASRTIVNLAGTTMKSPLRACPTPDSMEVSKESSTNDKFQAARKSFSTTENQQSELIYVALLLTRRAELSGLGNEKRFLSAFYSLS
jgi:hypothetical protein